MGELAVKPKAILVAAVVAVLHHTAAVADTSGPVIIGAGNDKCSSWTAARAKKESFEYETWIYGAFSGISMSHDGDFLKDTDANALSSLVDQECQLRPDETIVEAVARIARRYLQ
jgi:hypothetical protein